MNKLLYIFFILICLSGVNQAQDAKSDFTKINLRYNESKNLNMKVCYELFQDYTSIVPFQKMDGLVKRKGDNMIYKLGPLEVMHNKRFEVIANDEFKQIAMLEHKTKLFEWDEKLFLTRFDQTLQVYEKVNFSSKKNAGVYDIKTKGGQFTRIIIEFDKKTYAINKMVLYYRDAQILNEYGTGKKDTPRIEITYSDINLNANLPDGDFSESKYVAYSGGKYTCTSPYKGYKLKVELFNKNLKIK